MKAVYHKRSFTYHVSNQNNITHEYMGAENTRPTLICLDSTLFSQFSLLIVIVKSPSFPQQPTQHSQQNRNPGIATSGFYPNSDLRLSFLMVSTK